MNQKEPQMDAFYPKIEVETLRSLRTVRLMLIENPSYFLESPYGGEVENFFKEFFPSATKEIILPPTDASHLTKAPDRYDVLIEKTAGYIIDLEQVKNKTTDSGEAIQFYKAITGLMEKLIGLQERLLGMKQVSDFHRAVIDVMNDVLSADQRTQVMEKLDNAIKGAA